jgi:hypothetical protein
MNMSAENFNIIYCLIEKVLTRYNLGAIQHPSIQSNIDLKNRLTLPQGLAMKLGITPCFMPILLATYLYNIALSAIRRAEVYARAVS